MLAEHSLLVQTPAVSATGGAAVGDCGVLSKVSYVGYSVCTVRRMYMVCSRKMDTFC